MLSIVIGSSIVLLGIIIFVLRYFLKPDLSKRYEEYFGIYYNKFFTDGGLFTYSQLKKKTPIYKLFTVVSVYLIVSGIILILCELLQFSLIIGMRNVILFFIPKSISKDIFYIVGTIIGILFFVYFLLVFFSILYREIFFTHYKKEYYLTQEDDDEKAEFLFNRNIQKEAILGTIFDTEDLENNLNQSINIYEDAIEQATLQYCRNKLLDEECELCLDDEDLFESKVRENAAKMKKQSPESLKKLLKPIIVKKKDNSKKGFLDNALDFIDAGRSELSIEQDNYENILYVKECYQARLNVSLCKLKMEQNTYEYNINKANILASEVKTIINKLNPKERSSLFPKELKTYTLQTEGEEVLNLEQIELFSKSVSICQNNFSDSLKDAKNATIDFLAACFSGEESKLAIGINAVKNIGISAYNGILYFQEKRRANAQTAALYRENISQITTEITEIEKERNILDAFILRCKEINRGITNSLKIYKKTFNDLEEKLYGNLENSREKRKLRENYFTNEEITLLQQDLIPIVKLLMAVLDIEF